MSLRSYLISSVSAQGDPEESLLRLFTVAEMSTLASEPSAICFQKSGNICYCHNHLGTVGMPKLIA